MSKAVVILGAGASASFGVPTLRSIFKERQARQYLRDNPWLLDHLNSTFWQPRGYSLEESDQSLTIEEMLTIVRDLEIAGSTENQQDTQRFIKHLYILIQRAIYVSKSTQGKHLNPLITHLREQFDSITWASFNWDCIFEASFWYATGFDSRSRINPRLVVDVQNWRGHSSKDFFLKLHGGINWWMVNDRLTYFNFAGELQEKWRQYESAPVDGFYPVILEPSYYKYNHEIYQLLEPQWKFFSESLQQADFIIVIGYSLPEADNNARSALTCAFQMNSNARWAVVDPSQSVCDKYRRLLGRSRLTIFDKDLVAFNNDIEDNLLIAQTPF